MRRVGSLKDISDGKLYDWKDTVEVGCDGCQGSAACCRGMGRSIVLDPYDIYRITTNMDITFEQLLAHMVELNVVDGVILPNLKMAGENESCVFLDQDGRCTIHSYRPGICRIFPLGRYYEEHDFKYILQINECPCKTTERIKAGKWVDTPNLARNKQFLVDWHYFLNEVEILIKNTKDENAIKNINLYLLNQFYGRKYEGDLDFYQQFHDRYREARGTLMPET